MIKLKETKQTKGGIETTKSELFIGNLKLTTLNFKILENNAESGSFNCLSLKGKIKH